MLVPAGCGEQSRDRGLCDSLSTAAAGTPSRLLMVVENPSVGVDDVSRDNRGFSTVHSPYYFHEFSKHLKRRGHQP